MEIRFFSLHIVVLLVLKAVNGYAEPSDRSVYIEGVIKPSKMEYIEFMDDTKIPNWLGGSAVGQFMVHCGYRTIYGVGYNFPQRKHEEIILHELLTENCRDSTIINLVGEYLYLAQNVNGSLVVEDAGLIRERLEGQKILLEHEDGEFLKKSKVYDVKNKKDCEGLYDSEVVKCITVEGHRN